MPAEMAQEPEDVLRATAYEVRLADPDECLVREGAEHDAWP